jgi:hypothetical protein
MTVIFYLIIYLIEGIKKQFDRINYKNKDPFVIVIFSYKHVSASGIFLSATLSDGCYF